MERLKLETIENIIKTHKTVVEVLENEKIDDDYDLSLDKCIIRGMKELKQYRIAEEKGLLLKLPCKKGTKIFQVSLNCNFETGNLKVKVIEEEFEYDQIDDFGKTIFLTKEEAEQAAKKIREEYHYE